MYKNLFIYVSKYNKMISKNLQNCLLNITLQIYVVYQNYLTYFIKNKQN